MTANLRQDCSQMAQMAMLPEEGNGLRPKRQMPVLCRMQVQNKTIDRKSMEGDNMSVERKSREKKKSFTISISLKQSLGNNPMPTRYTIQEKTLREMEEPER